MAKKTVHRSSDIEHWIKPTLDNDPAKVIILPVGTSDLQAQHACTVANHIFDLAIKISGFVAVSSA